MNSKEGAMRAFSLQKDQWPLVKVFLHPWRWMESLANQLAEAARPARTNWNT